MKNKTKIIASTIVSLLLIGFIVIYFESTGKINIIPNQELQKTQVEQEGELKKEDIVSDPKANSDTSTKDSSNTSDYSPPQNADNIDLDARQDSQQVIITTKLMGYSDGTCTLNVKNGAKTLSRTAKVMFQRDYSMCAGFSLPVSDVGAGIWDISLAVTSGSSTQTKTLTLEVKQ